jgi:hypothetical protein
MSKRFKFKITQFDDFSDDDPYYHQESHKLNIPLRKILSEFEIVKHGIFKLVFADDETYAYISDKGLRVSIGYGE